MLLPGRRSSSLRRGFHAAARSRSVGTLLAVWWFAQLSTAQSDGAAPCISRPFTVVETLLWRAMSPEEVEEVVADSCATDGGLCRPREEEIVRSAVLSRLEELRAQEPKYTSASVRLVLDRTMDVEMVYRNVSGLVKLSPGADATAIASMLCRRLGLHHDDQECVVLAQLMASKVRELSDVCHHDADLPGRSQAAAPSSPVLGPYLVQGVLSHLSPSSSLTEADLRWEAVSPGHGSTVEGKGPVGMSIVLKAGDVELSLLEVEAVTGVNLTVLAMLDFDFWRVMTSAEAVGSSFLAHRGQHVCLFQVFDHRGYSVSSLMRSAFRWGRYLWELEGPQQTQAFYSIYPSRLFHRAQMLERTQRHREAVQSFELAVSVLGWDQAPQPPPQLQPLSPRNEQQPSTERFISFHMMQGGLNNQVVEVAGMVAIANALNRTLVPPSFWSGDFIGNSHVLPFSRLFDLHATAQNLAGYVRLWQGVEEGGEAPPVPATMDVPHWFTDKLDLDFFRKQLGGPQSSQIPHVILSGSYGQFHAHAGPLIFKQVSGALVFSQEVKSLADRVVSLLLRLAQGGGYMAVHTRVEVDWQNYCRGRELAAGGKVSFWFGCEDIASRIERQPRLRHLRVVYVAVGAGMVEDCRGVLEERLGEDVKVVSKWDLMPDTLSLPYTLQSAVDVLVCERAAAFVGTSYSTFSNAVAVRFHELGKAASFLYNLRDADSVQARTDAGLLYEPYDATYSPPGPMRGWRPEEGRAALNQTEGSSRAEGGAAQALAALVGSITADAVC